MNGAIVHGFFVVCMDSSLLGWISHHRLEWRLKANLGYHSRDLTGQLAPTPRMLAMSDKILPQSSMTLGSFCALAMVELTSFGKGGMPSNPVASTYSAVIFSSASASQPAIFSTLSTPAS